MNRAGGYIVCALLAATAFSQPPPKWVEEGLLTAEENAEGFYPLFNGEDLDGWWVRGTNKEAFLVRDGVLVVTGAKDGDWLFTNDQYDNFVLRYEYRCVSGEGNSGVGIRAAKEGNPAFSGMEIQVLRPGWETPYQRCGSLYHTVAPKVEADKPFGEWNQVEVLVDGARVRTIMNGQELYDVQMTDFTAAKIAADRIPDDWRKPLDDRVPRGYIALQDHEDQVEFRNLRLKPLPGGVGHISLFNGKNLDGWEVLRDPVWGVTPEGYLRVSGPQGWDKGRNAIRTKESFADFELYLSFRPHAPRANSGVFFRCSGDDPWPRTYEAQIDNHDPKQFTGAIWDQVPASELRAADDRWNHMRITAAGPSIQVWVNGKTVVDYISDRHARYPRGWIILQGHDPGSTVDFKDIEIKPLAMEALR
jgi:hypothetical protein